MTVQCTLSKYIGRHIVRYNIILQCPFSLALLSFAIYRQLTGLDNDGHKEMTVTSNWQQDARVGNIIMWPSWFMAVKLFLGGTPPQSYETSLAIWDNTVLPATRHK